jgi:uncharacterized protein YndB with AHSA1/START domain
MTRQHIHEEEFGVSKEEMFELLVTPSLICKWWGAARAIVIPEVGGIWMAAWGEDEDSPDYITAFTMSEFEPPRRILFTDAKYTAGGEKLPFEADIVAEFEVSESLNGCSLKVVQDGFPTDPAADEYYAACETGWKDTFAGIRRTLEESQE